MAKHGKRVRKAYEGIDREKTLAGRRGGEDGQGRAKAKFDETIEMAHEPRRRHRATPTRRCAAWSRLPSGTGKNDARRGVRQGRPKAQEAQAAGADIVGAEDLAEKVHGGPDRFRPRDRRRPT